MNKSILPLLFMEDVSEKRRSRRLTLAYRAGISLDEKPTYQEFVRAEIGTWARWLSPLSGGPTYGACDPLPTAESFRQINQNNIRVLFQPVEYDMLAVGSDVECTHIGWIVEICERAAFHRC